MDKEDMILVEGTKHIEKSGFWIFKKEEEIIINNFLIGNYPVTQGLYQQLMAKNPSEFNGENHPVETVDWWDAIEFCNNLSQSEGLRVAYDLESGELLDKNANSTMNLTQVEGYRLPTAREWEFAAKGGNKSQDFIYAASNNLAEVGWYSDNSNGETHPVGEKKANELGVYDLSGNVWEWCHDSYRNSLAKNIRGGAFNNQATDCYISSSQSDLDQTLSSNLGFRIAISKI